MSKRRRNALSFALLVCACAYLRWSHREPGRGAAGNPLASLSAGGGPLRGRVEEHLRAGSYSYLALRTEDRQLAWAVTMGSGAPPGARVSVRSMGHAAPFYSRRLQREFADLTFGIVTRED